MLALCEGPSRTSSAPTPVQKGSLGQGHVYIPHQSSRYREGVQQISLPSLQEQMPSDPCLVTGWWPGFVHWVWAVDPHWSPWLKTSSWLRPLRGRQEWFPPCEGRRQALSGEQRHPPYVPSVDHHLAPWSPALSSGHPSASAVLLAHSAESSTLL